MIKRHHPSDRAERRRLELDRKLKRWGKGVTARDIVSPEFIKGLDNDAEVSVEPKA